MEILLVIISIIILIYSSILHEIAHGYVAYRLGDPTAKLLGRLSLNPRSHIDPMMSIAMPVLTYVLSQGRFIFGGAKPVPVDAFNFREGIKDLALVSLAGPMTNILLAVLGTILAHLLFPGMLFGEIEISGFGGFILSRIIYLNLLLAIFNLVPIPPLDGSKIFAMILPPRQRNTFLGLQSMGFVLLIAFIYLGGMAFVTSLINFSLRLLGL